MERITLCDLRNESNHYELSAIYAEDKLTITGENNNINKHNTQAIGHFEYHYFLDEENTSRFFEKLNMQDFKEIKEAFHGINASRNFREFCNDNNIAFSYYNTI